MSRLGLIAAISFGVALLGAGAADAKSCKDASGKFVACPAAAPAKADKPAKTTTAKKEKAADAKPAKTEKTTTAKAEKAAKPAKAPADKAAASASGTCRDASGHFVKCPATAAATPKSAPAAKTTTASTPASKPSIFSSMTKSKPAPAVKTASASTGTPTAARSSSDPVGATARCKDGAYSHAQNHSGACSGHGGVAQWIN